MQETSDTDFIAEIKRLVDLGMKACALPTAELERLIGLAERGLVRGCPG